MLNVGDKVLYPMHGAGVIQGIEKSNLMGQEKSYYILKLPFGEMKIMIPVESVAKVGLRAIIPKSEAKKVFDVLKAKPKTIATAGSWNKRFNANMLKLKSGSIYEVAELVKNLFCQDKRRKISTGERRLFDTAKQVLVSELMLACDQNNHDVERLVYASLEENIAEKENAAETE
jgi:CarD family transcriptional regulator